MQQAIPYRSWRPLITHNHTQTTNFTITPHSLTTHNYSSSVSPKNLATEGMVFNKVSENAVIVFARRGCCMSHVVKRLLLGLGVNPAVHEVEEKDEVGVVRELEAIVGAIQNDGKVQFPAVFIGGKLFGGLDRLMATHISGQLVPILKEAGALWL
ncbi:glutaredoxin-C9-like [Gastrolobium bilobum]|uniref:glutaredoxin-C9-like n=1 Tax=Gastrolobium bilobum TaxID=150636 RepID=UPI002AB1F604|nr:glutaredoxin-C9-like [Gastrolobium bilobum]